MKKFLGISLIIFSALVFFFSVNHAQAQEINPPCRVKSNGAYFQPSGTLSGYEDTNKPLVKVVVETENCTGKKIEISITEEDSGTIANDDSVKGFDNLEVPVSSGGIVELTVKAGEDECEQFTPGFDCDYFYIEVDGSAESYSSEGKPNGELRYDCNTICDEYFEFHDIGYGTVSLKWFFFQSSSTDISGAFDTKEACETARSAHTNPTGANCFSKITFSITPPPGTNFTPGTSSYDDTYELLAPIPGLVPNNIVTKDFKIGDFVNNLIKVVIGLAAVLAVIMIVFGGIEWMMSDSFLGKTAGRERIKNALMGLLLALGSYLILYTINPDLTNINLGISKQTIKVQEIGDDGNPIEITYSDAVGQCPTDCVNLLPEVPIKNSSGKQAEKEFKAKLATLAQGLNSDSIIQGRWGTTEAWQPSRIHKAQCHQKGTCIDANFNGINGSPAAVKVFVQRASAVGLCAVYEVQNEQEKNIIVQGGVPSKNVKNYGTWISAPHFSIYGGSCK